MVDLRVVSGDVEAATALVVAAFGPCEEERAMVGVDPTEDGRWQAKRDRADIVAVFEQEGC